MCALKNCTQFYQMKWARNFGVRMKELEKIAVNIREKLGIGFDYYREGDNKKGVPVCERQFEEMDDDGEFLFFRFSYKQIGFIGVLN